jgi:hypothetical protein
MVIAQGLIGFGTASQLAALIGTPDGTMTETGRLVGAALGFGALALWVLLARPRY